ncbi:MAG: hypothetical protein P1U82_17475, partial [Verrucomicrobiales bacterium]|nr:hypothetical protein [Verrucomicrobiales bacterium]
TRHNQITRSRQSNSDRLLAAKNPDLVQEILEPAAIARDDLGDKYQTGKGVRPAGLVDRAVPLVKP